MECMYSVNRYIFLFFHTNTHKETVLSKHLVTLLNLNHQLFFLSLDDCYATPHCEGRTAMFSAVSLP